MADESAHSAWRAQWSGLPLKVRWGVMRTINRGEAVRDSSLAVPAAGYAGQVLPSARLYRFGVPLMALLFVVQAATAAAEERWLMLALYLALLALWLVVGLIIPWRPGRIEQAEQRNRELATRSPAG